MRRPFWIAVLTLSLSLLSVPVRAISGEVPDHPVAGPATDRVTKYRLYAMHQAGDPPYRYELVAPSQSPLTGDACLRALRTAFLEHKRPVPAGEKEPQTVMLLQWLSIRPDPKPDFAKWIGCWVTGSPFWVAWEMHTATSSDEAGVPPYWYKPWVPQPQPRTPEQIRAGVPQYPQDELRAGQPQSAKACLAFVARKTGRRHGNLLNWYDVRPDPLPDREKRLGCFPKGFDPEVRDAK